MGRSINLNSSGCSWLKILLEQKHSKTLQLPHLGGDPERKHSPLWRMVLHQELVLPSIILQVFIFSWSLGHKKLLVYRLLVQDKRSCSGVSFHLWLAGFRAVPHLEKSHEKSI